MTVIYSLLVIAIAAGVLWTYRDPSPKRASIFALFAVLSLASILDSLGAPKPFWMEWRKDLYVVALEYDPGVSIFVWVRGNPPIAYSMPWSEKQAEQLERGLREAKEKGNAGLLIYRTDYGEFVPYPEPVRGAPYKE